ncbi:MAG TPA: sugar transferase [Rhabdochlamydiaceae bacterium]|nr:sugar transferase [Rhabdochlamydiaceae bacterium]
MSINQVSSTKNNAFLNWELSFKIDDSKRVFDIVFSLFALLLISPLLILISIAIKLTSPGPVFYFSERLGKDEKIIRCLKFRTMCLDADSKLAQLLQTNPKLRLEWKKYSKLKNDPRIIGIGKLLRKTSLDELPQFWNVLRGDLSVVGPRPFTNQEIKKYRTKKEKILSIRPGITGIWQTSGRNLLTFEERLNLDEAYLEQQSFILDLKLIWKTILIMFFPKGAY